MIYTDFNKDFVDRTLEILNTYQGEFEITLLINCLVGLLILPKEKCFEAIPDVNIQELDDWGIKQEHITKIKCECCGYKLRNIARQLRNGVAHMQIKPIAGNADIEVLEFKDVGFTARIPVSSLRTFALKLAATVTAA